MRLKIWSRTISSVLALTLAPALLSGAVDSRSVADKQVAEKANRTDAIAIMQSTAGTTAGTVAARVLSLTPVPSKFAVVANIVTNQDLTEIVNTIVSNAEKGKKDQFLPYLEENDKSRVGELIEMIKRSDMTDNYKERMQPVSRNRVNLNYHYPKKNCYFQIEVKRESKDDEWKILKIWFTMKRN
ncbi:MAG: hypothetical protein K9N48_05180 [Verrucomicrobia bacterium]|nr:hypothetical protein [Verrucomicrobiota bacterium]MCF7708647.1 hypothetical protein [Verrucomicrobiota bacterium]